MTPQTTTHLKNAASGARKPSVRIPNRTTRGSCAEPRARHTAELGDRR
jgi:hypothetical protein